MSGMAPLDFSVIVAFLLPGFVGLYALTFISPRMAQLLELALSEKAGVGPTFGILLFSLAVGVMLSGTRTLIVDPIQRRLSGGWPTLNYRRLGDPAVLAAFKEAISATYRFSQFYGNIFVALLVFLVAKYAVDPAQIVANWPLFILTCFATVVLFVSHARALKETYQRLSEILGS